MRLDTTHIRLGLESEQLTRLTDACGTRIDCLHGTAWITVDGDLRDIVLSPGESFVVDARAPVIVHAIFGPATVALHAHEPACAGLSANARPRRRRGWIASLVPSAAAA